MHRLSAISGTPARLVSHKRLRAFLSTVQVYPDALSNWLTAYHAAWERVEFAMLGGNSHGIPAR
jgi:hypothetical protein